MSLPDLTKTVIALSTPPGKGALAVIRITGEQSFRIFSKISLAKYSNAAHKQVSLAKIHDGKKYIDDAVAVFFKSPKSYTGDDTVEIMCHGSPYIIREILNAAIKNGAVSAAPGEFTLRAFLNGKMDLSSAEAVNALIASDSEVSHNAAIMQAAGGFSAFINGLKDKALSLLAEIEARIDDSDGEIADFDYEHLISGANGLKNGIQEAVHSFKNGKNIKDGIKVVLAGAPNAGKSSLMNVLLGYDRAIVSPHAGTTRDVLEAAAEINGFKIILTDTAGLSASADNAIEQEGMKRALSALRQADIVLLLKDSSCPESPADKIAAKQIKENMPAGAELIRVYTKKDICNKKISASKGRFFVSSLTGNGIAQLCGLITKNAQAAANNNSAPAVIFARHYQALSGALAEINMLILKLQENSAMPEIAAEHLRAALNQFGLITGETAPDDVLEKIFSTFCVGK